MQIRRLSRSVLVLLIASACGLFGCGRLTTISGTNVARGHAELVLNARVISGSASIQAIVPSYSRADINHVVIRVFTLENGSERNILDADGRQVSLDITGTELSSPVRFSNLNANTVYRVKCWAYKTPGENQSGLISSEAASKVDIAITNEDKPTISPLVIRLLDVAFDGHATSGGTEVTDGGISSAGPVSIGKVRVDYVWVSTLAGSTRGYADGPTASSQFDSPTYLALDPTGVVFISDVGNQRVRRILPSGLVETFASISTLPGRLFYGTSCGIAANPEGGVLLAATQLYKLVRVNSNGVNTFAGNGQVGYADSDASNAMFNQPIGIAVDAGGNVYVADANNHCIRKVGADGTVTTFAGSGVPGRSDGQGSSATFYHPTGLAIENDGSVLVADTDNHEIRRVSPSGMVTTIAGNGDYGDEDGPAASAHFDQPTGLAVDASGGIYVADTNNNCIRKIGTNGFVSTLAGSGWEGAGNGNGIYAQFAEPTGLCIGTNGSLLVADTGNHLIRKIDFTR